MQHNFIKFCKVIAVAQSPVIAALYQLIRILLNSTSALSDETSWNRRYI